MPLCVFFFFFNDTATTEIYTLSLHDALPISVWREFFKATDPVPITPENEALDEYFRRVEVANERFQEAGEAGCLTDRREVYISLGEPDESYDFITDVARTGARAIRCTDNSLRITLFFQDQAR